MRLSSKLVWATAVLGLHSLRILSAQDLAPRAYVITPLRSNAINLTESFYDGSINFNGALPVSDATGKYSTPILSYYHSFGFFGRSANVVVAFTVWSWKLSGNNQRRVRSSLPLRTCGLRLSRHRKPQRWTSHGGAAVRKVEAEALARCRSQDQSLATGQLRSTPAPSTGAPIAGRSKPELGYSQRWNHWVLDAYAGVWFFTTNNDFWSRNSFYAGTRSQSQQPIGAFEGHLSYDFKPRLWASIDGNYWFGGKTSVDGVQNPITDQANSRIGATVSVPITKHQSLKFSYSNGTYIRYGGNYQNVSAAWQYSWLGNPLSKNR